MQCKNNKERVSIQDRHTSSECTDWGVAILCSESPEKRRIQLRDSPAKGREIKYGHFVRSPRHPHTWGIPLMHCNLSSTIAEGQCTGKSEVGLLQEKAKDEHASGNPLAACRLAFLPTLATRSTDLELDGLERRVRRYPFIVYHDAISWPYFIMMCHDAV